ncbi:transport protein Avl9-domain-containing protein [Lactarius akahatsu]|uniref:Transport protein Avl9-domain-containing protein n=1 Tax=Lactarius akahatsu TaxID=416441 RepID=A0AAD4L6W0_9AGAM|nr:transport protein Avl9-domain-containing protein [Lactarius akahatsu]
MSSDNDNHDHDRHHSEHGLTLDLQGALASHDYDTDTASQHSISFTSPAASTSTSPHHSPQLPTFSTVDTARRQSHPYTTSTGSSDDPDDISLSTGHTSSVTSPGGSVLDHDEDAKPVPPTPLPAALERNAYPPAQPWSPGRSSVASFATSTSSFSRKVRPESLLIDPPKGPLILGIALVDFNHQVGPRIQFSVGSIFEDEEINKILPFLALPDGAHLATEDYSYFHLVPSVPNPSTIFGISCNRQIATSSLLVKEVDMTRSTVQKAVVVLASGPVFGPIRDRLGVVTLALFEQKDFTSTDLLVDFYQSLQGSLRSQLTESGLYMGTSLRELVHEFRHRALVLVKALILQKKIMFYGHPVERLCTYQYSLISLIPGLLQTLQDSGSPPLATRAPTLCQPTSLRTSDRRSLLAYLGLPLDLFGKDAFFQPYLPLQQLDLIKSQTRSFLCGSTNAIVRQQNDIELLVDIETCSIEFRDPKIERAVALTPADRKWVDEIVKDVNDTWDTGDSGMRRFKGSDDYVRIKFEEYISAALASVKYGDFLAKGDSSGVLITPGSGGDSNALQDFNPVWIAEFRRTNAFDVWQRVTDPMLFDIIEPRHPCNEKPSAISDITLRLSEGIQDLKLEQQLAPTREAISRTINAGSANFFKAVEGVKGRLMQRSGSTTSVGSASTSSGTVISSSEIPDGSALTTTPPTQSAPTPAGVDPAAILSKERLSGWGTSVGTFFSSRAARFSTQKTTSPNVSAPSSTTGSPVPPPQQPPWLAGPKASISGSTGDVGATLVTKTPPPGPASAVDLSEKTPQGPGFRLGGDAESRVPGQEHRLEREQDGDSDEEPSFGVAL